MAKVKVFSAIWPFGGGARYSIVKARMGSRVTGLGLCGATGWSRFGFLPQRRGRCSRGQLLMQLFNTLGKFV